MDLWVLNTKNEVMIDDEEVPKNTKVTYMLEAPAQVEDKKLAGQEISVVFCVDVSGSMCVTQAINGKHQIKGDTLKERNQRLR